MLSTRKAAAMESNILLLLGLCAVSLAFDDDAMQGCADKRDQRTCDYYKGYNFCYERYVEWMRNNCPMTCGFCDTGKCGISSVQSGRVIWGKDAKPGAWPWQILMLINAKESCGGSLIAPNWVVTAAHCVSGASTQSVIVRVGEHNFQAKNGTEDDIQVSKIIVHPSYISTTKDFDIALMKLSRPAKMNTYVNTVCLPKQGQHVQVGTQCYITGWGRITVPGDMHHILQQAKMPVVSKQACTNVNRRLGYKITDNMVCAGYYFTSGCHGDSGGPFVCQTGSNGRWELHGVVSWGSPICDGLSRYTVFARVAQLSSWIDQTMQNK